VTLDPAINGWAIFGSAVGAASKPMSQRGDISINGDELGMGQKEPIDSKVRVGHYHSTMAKIKTYQ